MAAWLCAPRPPPCGARLRARSVAGMRARLPPRAAPLPLRRFTAPPRPCARLLVLLAAALGTAGCAERSLCRRVLAPARTFASAVVLTHAAGALLARGEGVQWRNDQDHSARGVRDRVLRRTYARHAGLAGAQEQGGERAGGGDFGGSNGNATRADDAKRRFAASRAALRAANDAFCEDEDACADGLPVTAAGSTQACSDVEGGSTNKTAAAASSSEESLLALCAVGEARHTPLVAPALARNLLARLAAAEAPSRLRVVLFVASYLTQDSAELELIARFAAGLSGNACGPFAGFDLDIGGVFMPTQGDTALIDALSARRRLRAGHSAVQCEPNVKGEPSCCANRTAEADESPFVPVAEAAAAASTVVPSQRNRNLGAGGLDGVLAYLRLHDACAFMIEEYERRASARSHHATAGVRGPEHTAVRFDAIVRTRVDGLWTAPVAVRTPDAKGRDSSAHAKTSVSDADAGDLGSEVAWERLLSRAGAEVAMPGVRDLSDADFYTFGDFSWGGLNDRFSMAGRGAGLRMLRRTRALVRTAAAASAPQCLDGKVLAGVTAARERAAAARARAELPPKAAARVVERRSRLAAGDDAFSLTHGANSEKLTLAAAALSPGEVIVRHIRCASWPLDCATPYCVLSTRRAALGFHDQLGTPLAIDGAKCEPCEPTGRVAPLGARTPGEREEVAYEYGLCPRPTMAKSMPRSSPQVGWARGWEVSFETAIGTPLAAGLGKRDDLARSPGDCAARWSALLRAGGESGGHKQVPPVVVPAGLRASDVCALSGWFDLSNKTVIAELVAGDDSENGDPSRTYAARGAPAESALVARVGALLNAVEPHKSQRARAALSRAAQSAHSSR